MGVSNCAVEIQSESADGHIISCDNELPSDMDCLPHAVCYDCICLMPLIWSTIPLFSDGDGTVTITGYDGGYDGSPAGTIRLFTTAFVLTVGYGRDDATSDEDQWTGFRHIDF